MLQKQAIHCNMLAWQPRGYSSLTAIGLFACLVKQEDRIDFKTRLACGAGFTLSAPERNCCLPLAHWQNPS